MESKPQNVEVNAVAIPVETIKLNGLNLTLIPIDHLASEYERNKSQLSGIIPGLDAIVIEYDPDELAKVPFVASLIPESYSFFKKVVEISKESAVDTIRLDPAHDENFVVLRSSGLAGLSAALLGGLTLSTGIVTRRDFLKLAGGLAMLTVPLVSTGAYPLTVEQYFDQQLPYNGEPDFRRAIVADHLVEISKDPKHKGEKIGIIYPPFHLVGAPRDNIKKLLSDDDQRRNIIKEFNWALTLSESHKDSFTTGQRMTWEQDKRILKEKYTIT